MHKCFISSLLLAAILFACMPVIAAPGKYLLKPSAFQHCMQWQRVLLIDVSTPDEYAQGHIKGSINIDWTGSDFDDKIAALGNDRPALVYDHNGSKSALAADNLRKAGFKEVYELKGGLQEWLADKKQVEKDTSLLEMSMERYKQLLATDRLTLVDFSAPWCIPCRNMAPSVDALEKDKAGVLKVIRINTDEHQHLATELQVTGLPTVFIYKQGKVVWRHIGYTTKEVLYQAVDSLK